MPAASFLPPLALQSSRKVRRGTTVPLLLLIALIAGGVVVGVSYLQRHSEEAQRQQLVLTRIRLRASELSTLAARTLEVGRLSSVSDEHYRRLSIELRALTDEARRSPLLYQAFGRAGLESSVRADIEAKNFAASLEDEFAWLRLGRLDDAREVQERRAAPGYDALSTTVDSALEAFDDYTARLVRTTSLGTAGLCLVGLFVVAGLLLHSARQQARRDQAEQESLRGANSELREENEIRRRTEEALDMARTKAEEMARLKDAFLASMSHEIRTPLMAILGYSELLREQAPPELRDYADQIEAGGHRLLDTLTSVLDFAKIEAGQMEPVFTVVDAGAVAQAVEAELQGLAARKHLALTLRLPETPVYVRGDSGFVHRALYNLVSNAIKFTDQGRVDVSVQVDQGGASFTVRDTGPGISEGFLPHLFEEFRQESAGERRSHEGSGLGLAITRRLVECMNGAIQVASRLGDGATFTIQLPLAHEPAASVPTYSPTTDRYRSAAGTPSSPASPAPPHITAPPVPHTLVVPPSPNGDGAGHQGRDRAVAHLHPAADAEERPAVLLLEDNAASASAIGLMLPNYRVEHAETYDEAIARVRDGRFDALLLDINLREARTGVDVLRSVRHLPRYAATPAIALTAYALPGDEERFRQAGFDAYLSKPFRKAALQDVLARLLSERGAPSVPAPAVPLADLEMRPAPQALHDRETAR